MEMQLDTTHPKSIARVAGKPLEQASLPPKISYEAWFNPLSNGKATLQSVYDSLQRLDGALNQKQVPRIIQWVENPKYDLPGVEFFPGATDLFTHDCIHILLGRGLTARDEAFVLGFTMGATDLMGTFRSGLFLNIVKYLYPKDYKLSKDEQLTFRHAWELGDVSSCVAIHKVNYRELMHLPIEQIRKKLGIEENLLRAYYEIESARFPNAPECRRLLSGPSGAVL
jgi:hypothetical protein